MLTTTKQRYHITPCYVSYLPSNIVNLRGRYVVASSHREAVEKYCKLSSVKGYNLVVIPYTPTTIDSLQVTAKGFREPIEYAVKWRRA